MNIIERTSHETIITTADCKYIAVVEAFYGSETERVEI